MDGNFALDGSPVFHHTRVAKPSPSQSAVNAGIEACKACGFDLAVWKHRASARNGVPCLLEIWILSWTTDPDRRVDLPTGSALQDLDALRTQLAIL